MRHGGIGEGTLKLTSRYRMLDGRSRRLFVRDGPGPPNVAGKPLYSFPLYYQYTPSCFIRVIPYTVILVNSRRVGENFHPIPYLYGEDGSRSRKASPNRGASGQTDGVYPILLTVTCRVAILQNVRVP